MRVGSVPCVCVNAAFMTILAERFRIIGPLGSGGMGAVYEAEDVTTGAHVALKLAHGTNERVSLENLTTAVRVYRRFVENATAPPPAESG